MKKYLVSVFILVVLWGITWQVLSKYEDKFPNKSITEFAKTVFSDLRHIEIVKSSHDNDLFEVCENGNRLIQVLALKDEGEWEVTLEKQYVDPIKIYVPEDALVYVEDELLEESNTVPYEPIDRYSLLSEKELLPKIDCYVVDNYIDVPQIKVISKEKECGIVVKDRIVDAVLDLSSKEKDELEEVLLNTATLYARYITNDAKFSELSNFLYKNTEFYKEVRNFFNDWYAHDGYEFRDLEIMDIKQVADNAFYGEISFNYILKKGRKEFPFPSNYQIYFIKSLNSWKAICIDTK